MMFPCNCCGCCCRNIGNSPLYKNLDRGDGICKHLSGNLCAIYEDRPLLCRVDDCYDIFFYQIMEREEYYKLNMAICKELKEREE